MPCMVTVCVQEIGIIHTAWDGMENENASCAEICFEFPRLDLVSMRCLTKLKTAPKMDPAGILKARRVDGDSSSLAFRLMLKMRSCTWCVLLTLLVLDVITFSEADATGPAAKGPQSHRQHRVKRSHGLPRSRTSRQSRGKRHHNSLEGTENFRFQTALIMTALMFNLCAWLCVLLLVSEAYVCTLCTCFDGHFLLLPIVMFWKKMWIIYSYLFAL